MRMESRMIIDTKFADIMTVNQHGKSRLHSNHIYQIYAYLRSQEKEIDPPSLTASGMILHPSLGLDVDESVTIQGHRIRFATVNLATNNESIRKRLLDLVL